MPLFPIGINNTNIPGREQNRYGNEVVPDRDRRRGWPPDWDQQSFSRTPRRHSSTQVVAPNEEASVVIAAILQRGTKMNSASGCLRNLTAKAKKSKFLAWPMLIALWRESQGLTKRE